MSNRSFCFQAWLVKRRDCNQCLAPLAIGGGANFPVLWRLGCRLPVAVGFVSQCFVLRLLMFQALVVGF